MRSPRLIPPDSVIRTNQAILRALSFLVVLGIISALYFAKAVFLPLATAGLLTFILAPPARLLRSWGMGRVASVIIVVLFAGLFILGVSAMVGQQLTQLAGQLPQYESTIKDKIRRAQESAGSNNTLQELSRLVGVINKEASNQQDRSTARPADKPQPMPVQVEQPPAKPIELIQRFVQPLVDPVTLIGLIVIFVIFFLLQREDLRDRIIKLAGSHDLHRTTDAMNDGAHRLSRYFFAQTALNALFGIVVGLGLAVIGLPNPALWGIMGMLLRFVPYIGALIAASFPVVLSVAVDPGWAMTAWTVALFVVVEPLIGQVLEPLIYGQSTGISPVAIIVSATFWTWLWGPAGLLLSTPLAVCIGVLGRHIESLRFIDIMIGEKSALTPAQSFYQRALADDADEALDQMEQNLKECNSRAQCYDEVALGGLHLARVDAERGLLSDVEIRRVNRVVEAVIADFSDQGPTPDSSAPEAREEKSTEARPGDKAGNRAPPLDTLGATEIRPDWNEEPVVCIPGRGAFDEASARLLTDLVTKSGLSARIEPARMTSSLHIDQLVSQGVRAVYLCSFGLGHSTARLRHSIRRLRNRMPGVRIVACLWGYEGGERPPHEDTDAAAADAYVFSLREAIDDCVRAARIEADNEETKSIEGDRAA